MVLCLEFSWFALGTFGAGKSMSVGENASSVRKTPAFVPIEGIVPKSDPPLASGDWCVQGVRNTNVLRVLFAVQPVQMSGVSGDKLCRSLPLPTILSHFHYLPFVEAVIYCILQPCNLWLFYNSFQAFRSNSSTYPSAFHCHT